MELLVNYEWADYQKNNLRELSSEVLFFFFSKNNKHLRLNVGVTFR